MEGHQTVGHDHIADHFFGVIRFQYRAREAVGEGDEYIGTVMFTQGVGHHRIRFAAAVAVENTGVSFRRGQNGLRGGFLGLTELFVKGFVSLLRIVFSRDHLRDHILRRGKEVVGGDTDIHMILFDQRFQVGQMIGQMDAHILTVAQNIPAVGKDRLPFFGDHYIQNFHGLFAAGVVLFQIAVKGHLQIRGGHQPLFPVLTEIGQDDRIDPLFQKFQYPHGAAADHGGLTVLIHFDHGVVAQPQIGGGEIRIFNKLFHPLKGDGPDNIVHADTIRIGGIGIRRPPPAAFFGGQFRNGQTLQRFHAGVVVNIIADIAADADFLKGFAGGNKAFVIRGQRDIILFKQFLVGNESVYIGAHRQPVDTAVLIGEAGEICIVDRAGFGSRGQIHEAVLQRRGVVKGKTAAGDDIRQGAVFRHELIEIKVIVAHHKLNIHIRQLRLDVRGVIFVHRVRPQIHRNGIRVFLCGVVLPATRKQ